MAYFPKMKEKDSEVNFCILLPRLTVNFACKICLRFSSAIYELLRERQYTFLGNMLQVLNWFWIILPV